MNQITMDFQEQLTAAKLIVRSGIDVDWEYLSLTPQEHTCCTEQEYYCLVARSFALLQSLDKNWLMDTLSINQFGQLDEIAKAHL